MAATDGQLSRVLTLDNIDAIVAAYVASTEKIGESIRGQTGLQLVTALKRGTADAGPYPSVSIFEAANRIMTDLVILYGVRWLLGQKALPFTEYTVEYGHENAAQHDVMAQAAGAVLIGEAFNVAPSFFGTKKGKALKKLRNSGVSADYKLLIFNDTAVAANYAPQPGVGEFFVFVDVDSGAVRAAPSLGDS